MTDTREPLPDRLRVEAAAIASAGPHVTAAMKAMFDAAHAISTLTAERDEAKRGLALMQQYHATAWNRGHEAGMRANRDIAKQATEAVARDAWGNSQLTEALMVTEAERDALRAEVGALRDDARRLDWLDAEISGDPGGRRIMCLPGGLRSAIDAASQKEQIK